MSRYWKYLTNLNSLLHSVDKFQKSTPKGQVTSYGEGVGLQNRRGGASEVLPLHKRGGGGRTSLSQAKGGGGTQSFEVV